MFALIFDAWQFNALTIAVALFVAGAAYLMLTAETLDPYDDRGYSDDEIARSLKPSGNAVRVPFRAEDLDEAA